MRNLNKSNVLTSDEPSNRILKKKHRENYFKKYRYVVYPVP